MAEEEDGKNKLWQAYVSGDDVARAHITEILDALGLLYGERVKEEVHRGLLCILEDRESLRKIGLIVKLCDGHLWDPLGHFSMLEWGGVDLYAYLERYGIE